MATMSTPARATAVAALEPLSGAYWWVVAFSVVTCARPEDWIPGLHAVPLAKITGFFALLAFLMSIGQVRRRLPKEILYMILLLGQLFLTVPLSPIWPGGAFWHVLDFSKLVLILPVMVLVATTLARLRRLIFVQSASVATIAVIALAEHQEQGGRLKGPIGGIYENSNDLAVAVVLALPFCFAFLLRARGPFRKVALGMVMVVMTFTVFLTASRQGLLAFIVSMGVCLWEFAVKGGRRYLLVTAGIVALGAVVLAGGKMRQRFGSTFDPEENQMSAYGSTEMRWEMLRKGLMLTLEHPLFGIGPGNFKGTSGVWSEAHNSYLEMSSEGGLPAFILYLMILWRAFANVRATKRLVRGQVEELLFAGALHASLAGFVVGSFFGSVAFLYFPYFLVAYTSALFGIAEAQNTPQPESTRVR